MNYDILEKAFTFVAGQWPDAQPKRALICGSGWGGVVSAFNEQAVIEYDKIPGLGTPGVVGHAGRLVRAELHGQETLIFQGRRHYYESGDWTAVALPLFILVKMKVPVLVVTNAAGGIRSDLQPGDLMIIDDHINNMGSNPLVGPANPIWGPRFPDQTQVYDKELRKLADEASRAAALKVRHGRYLAGSGPTYETPAEIRAFKGLGADAVGMSTVPEAMLAHAAGIRVLGVSCITNLAAGISATKLSHEEVTATTKATMPRMTQFLSALWKEMANVKD